jgi:4-methylaminobutanoate oxidase (formaldehyde-forming)
MTDRQPPKQAKIVIIGGGIIGCSTAYHLAEMGCNDVVVIEKSKSCSRKAAKNAKEKAGNG